jgi:hypothetical protein
MCPLGLIQSGQTKSSWNFDEDCPKFLRLTAANRRKARPSGVLASRMVNPIPGFRDMNPNSGQKDGPHTGPYSRSSLSIQKRPCSQDNFLLWSGGQIRHCMIPIESKQHGPHELGYNTIKSRLGEFFHRVRTDVATSERLPWHTRP